jgi:hypothetical protein
MSQSIERYSYPVTAVLTNSLGSTPAIESGSCSQMAIRTPAGYSGGVTTIYGSESKDGTYAIVQDEDGGDVTVTLTADRMCVVPASVFPVPYLKLVLATDDSDPVVFSMKG